MEGNSSTLFVPSPQSFNSTNKHCDSRKKSPTTPPRLSNGLEKNEATLVAEGVAQSARRFHNDVGALQRRARRCDELTTIGTVAATIIKPEAACMALIEVREEEEEEVGERKIDGLAEPSFTNNRLSREAFFERSMQGLAAPETLLSKISSSTPTSSELNAALSTALARNARLLEQRRTQITRCLQLQSQVDSLSAELDASVDNLRHQRNRWEAEKLRSTLEARELRQQLSGALAAIQSVSRRSPHNAIATRQSGKEESNEGCTQCEQRNLEVSALQIAVERLESEMERQRRGAEQEAAQWAVQLADAAAENRSLRLQLSRSTTTTTTTVFSAAATAAAAAAIRDNETEGSCVNCRRLQQLVNVLQAKRVGQSEIISASNADRVSVCDATAQTAPLYEMTSSESEDPKDISLFDLLESGRPISQQQSKGTWQLQRSCKPPPLHTFHSPDATCTNVSRLQERLSFLESEVEASADRLKASNDEFLQLRQQLTNVTVEKAHLKATLDGLYDEASLQARTRELGRCQSEFAKHQVPASCVIRLQKDFESSTGSVSSTTTALTRVFSKCKKYAAVCHLGVFKFADARGAHIVPTCKLVACQLFRSRWAACVFLIFLCIYAFFLNILLLSCLAQ